MKKKVISFLIMFLILMQAGVVFGANSFNSRFVADKTALKPGDEIKAELSVSDLNMGDTGINTLQAVLNYDKNVFEQVTNSDIKSESNWSTTYNDETGILLSVNFSNGIKTDSKILTITFKVKDTISESTNSEIKLIDITSTEGTILVNSGTKTIKTSVTVANVDNNQKTDKDPEESGNKENNGNKEETSTNTIIPSQTNIVINPTEGKTTTNTATDTAKSEQAKSTEATSPIPQTGVSPMVLVVIALAIVGIGVTYIRYRSLSKDIK